MNGDEKFPAEGRFKPFGFDLVSQSEGLGVQIGIGRSRETPPYPDCRYKSIVIKKSHAENSPSHSTQLPHHIIQRGHSRQVVFASDEDYLQ